MSSVLTPSSGPSALEAWVLAARPKTLPAAFCPVMVGTAVAAASDSMHLGAAFAALAGAACIQVGTNLANDVFDFEKGADQPDRLGPLRAVQAGLLSPKQVRFGMWAAFLAASMAGVYLHLLAGPIVLLIGVFSILSGLAYTAGPWPLAYTGLGDLFVMLFFGFVAVMGTAFVQVGAVPEIALWVSVPVGALSTAILVVNNVRDREQDARARKRTLVVRWGRRFGEVEYWGLLLLAYLVPVLCFVLGHQGASIMLPLLSLPIAGALARRLHREEGRSLNGVLAGTAGLLLIHSVLLTLGILA